MFIVKLFSILFLFFFGKKKCCDYSLKASQCDTLTELCICKKILAFLVEKDN